MFKILNKLFWISEFRYYLEFRIWNLGLPRKARFIDYTIFV